MKGADPQPEYYIDKIVQLTAVSYQDYPTSRLARFV